MEQEADGAPTGRAPGSMELDRNAARDMGGSLLECEKPRVYLLLMLLGGFYGGFTYAVRGGVFCNAQTANFVLCAIKLARKDWGGAFYYVIPMMAYTAGIMVSELIAEPIKRRLKLRWETVLIGVEIVIVFGLGLIPDSAPFQISQVIVNFMAAMQFNTFRQAAKIPVATTFLTNHLRQLGVYLAAAISSRRRRDCLHRAGFHFLLIATFMVGVALAVILCARFSGKGVWFAILPLALLFADLFYADKVTEAGKLDVTPHGH